ncbi:MAG TPA: sigma 54-interacting transcriptional regulator [Terriglobia bacterium]|nr:sigma 54-interacting transcriptional regulator [Terriglobia bacterium]
MEAILNNFDARLTSCQALPPEGTIWSQTEGMRGLWQIAEKVAGTSAPILIVGEKGTGKEVLARLIHSCNPGAAAPFLKLTPQFMNGSAREEVALLLEPQESGASRDFCASGSSDRRTCTLLIEEISEAMPGCQLELLHWIQDPRAFAPVNGSGNSVALRVIGTSSRDLDQAVAAGGFRADLFSALSVVTLRLPPLRERKEDIPGLANYFWLVYSERFGGQPTKPSAELMDRFQQYDWPGNIRELESVMKRYVLLGLEGAKEVGPALEDRRSTGPVLPHLRSVSLKQVTREAAQALERKIILRTLQETRWNRRQAARALNISYRALLYKIKAAGLISDRARADVETQDEESLESSHSAA